MPGVSFRQVLLAGTSLAGALFGMAPDLLTSDASSSELTSSLASSLRASR